MSMIALNGMLLGAFILKYKFNDESVNDYIYVWVS